MTTRRNKQSGFYIKKSLIRLNLGYYWFWAGLRIFLTFLPQTGYIHPDEFFQSVEVFAGNVFDTTVVTPWEYNATFPLRSVPVMYLATSVPLTVLKIVAIIMSPFIITPYLVLLIPRLAICIFSFISDYCLYKICYLYGQNFRRRLLIFASSYVTLTYGTRTFNNTAEMILFNILLYLVADSMAESEKVNYQDDFLKEEYEGADSAADRVRIWKIRRLLPEHSTNHCFAIALVTVAGVFNRPTFLTFAVAPLFYWLQRGIRRDDTLIHFHLRFFLLLLYAMPVTLAFIFLDSAYYGYITWGEVLNGDVGFHSFVFTPLNFLRYNLVGENLAQHGLHPRWLHILINLPLLFNLLAVAAILVAINMIHRGSQSYWSSLPHPQSITGMMTLSLMVPVVALSAIPHQEPRFIAPVLLPLVFLYSHIITRFEEDCPAPVRVRKPKQNQLPFLSDFDNRANITGRYLTLINCQAVTGNKVPPTLGRYELLKVWIIINIICTCFYGFVHQGGVYPLAKAFRNQIENQPKFTASHLLYSHTYLLPQHLLMQPTPPLGKSASFSTTHLPSDLKLIFTKIEATFKKGEIVKRNRRRNYSVYYALPASVLPQFEIFHEKWQSNSSINFSYQINDVFIPHLSLEAPFYMPNLSMAEVINCFKLVLLELKLASS